MFQSFFRSREERNRRLTKMFQSSSKRKKSIHKNFPIFFEKKEIDSQKFSNLSFVRENRFTKIFQFFFHSRKERNRLTKMFQFFFHSREERNRLTKIFQSFFLSFEKEIDSQKCSNPLRKERNGAWTHNKRRRGRV